MAQDDQKVIHCDPVLRGTKDDAPPISAAYYTILLKNPQMLLHSSIMSTTTCCSSNSLECVQDVQSHITGKLVNWMMEVCEMKCCEGDHYILAVNYLDCCMCIISQPNDLNVIGTTCLFKTASCLLQSVPLSTLNVLQLLRMERKALNSLKWNLMAIIASNFVQHLLLCLFIPSDDPPQVSKHVDIFVMTSIADRKVAIRHRSPIAGISKIINSSPDCARACQEEIDDFLKCHLNSPCVPVYSTLPLYLAKLDRTHLVEIRFKGALRLPPFLKEAVRLLALGHGHIP
uniref:Cyclin N-terminal domain-containing protein n=1 Tax=Eptatretus burgeri TaxID=7764 RepID=A0A8C4QIS5_EPTBU